jgi:hypothetical protein
MRIPISNETERFGLIVLVYVEIGFAVVLLNKQVV